MFVCSSEFSLGQSLLSIDDIVSLSGDVAKVVVTDTMSVTAMIPLAEKLGDRLVIGVRLSIVDNAEQERARIYQPKIYPKNEAGIQLIYKYLSKSFERPYFYEQPRLDWALFYDMLREGSEDFYVSTGDVNSLMGHDRHSSICDSIAGIIGLENFILDWVPIKSPRFDRYNFNCYMVGKKQPSQCYIPAFYKQEDADIYPIHYSINKNVEFNFLKPDHQDFYYHDPMPAYEEYLKRAEKRWDFEKPAQTYHMDWSKAQHYVWKKSDPKLPHLSKDPVGTLRKLAQEGFKEKLTKPVYGYRPSLEALKTVYRDRLLYELDTLEKLGFADYFLLVYELTDWCRKQNIKIGPGRGSVGGSLVAFCLDITDVDPIRFGLMFERFINPTRLDLPDIDLDFMSTRRHEIVQHLIDRYGAENVSGIINYASLQAKSALRSTCRILGMDEQDYACSKLIPSNFGFSVSLEEAKEKVIEVGNFAKTFPHVWEKANKLEGKLRNFSTHAAGIIVSSRPLIKDAVIEVRSENRIINWDKQICEKQGLIKLDVLGLTTLDIIDLALSYIQCRHGDSIDIRDINLDDPKVLNSFANGNTGGIFQFEGGSVRKLLGGLAKSGNVTFDDLVAANALNRPGPIEAGLVDSYVKGKNGDIVDIDHSSMSEILEPTFNVMVYQEQIMKVAVEFAGYTLPEADNLRKIMGKKLPEAMKKEADKFIDGAVKTHGVDRSLAERIFDQISKFAFYAFNKSHSVEYSLLSYICMWLKTYYPVEYYAASLTYIDSKKITPIIKEAKKSGISVLPPSINLSTDKFTVKDDRTIVAPLSAIKYVQGAAEHIFAARSTGPFTSVEDLQARTVKRIVNKRVIDAMRAVGALDEIEPPTGPINKAERSKAINEYLASLPLGFVFIERNMALSHSDKNMIRNLGDKLAENDLVKPFVGSNARFMAIFDNPTGTEVKNGQFTISKGFTSTELALYRNDLAKADGYWTGLVKRAKEKKEKVFTNEILEKSFEIVKKEIAICKPPVIICLGSNVARMFEPSQKGGMADNAGRVIYCEEYDCNVVFGFSPGQIFFDPDKQETLNEVFEIVSSLL